MKNKAATNGNERRAEHSPRRPLFVQDDEEVFVTGSTLYAGDGGQPPGHNPLGHNPVTSWDITRRVFLLKTDTNPHS